MAIGEVATLVLWMHHRDHEPHPQHGAGEAPLGGGGSKLTESPTKCGPPPPQLHAARQAAACIAKPQHGAAPFPY